MTASNKFLTIHVSNVLVWLVLLATAGNVCAQPAGAKATAVKKSWTDIAYSVNSPSQKLDIYLPDSNVSNYPVIISIHGGAFMMGDKADAQVRPALAALHHGYAVVAINYRLSGESLFPANIIDVKAAIRFIKANAAAYNLNATKIALWGNSAGAYLAALAGVTANVASLDDPGSDNGGQSVRVQAVVDWYGPIDFLKMDAQLRATGYGLPTHNDGSSPESKLMGQPIILIPEKVKWANPETYISKDDPPFLIMHGEEDQLVPAQQSIVFSKKLSKVLGEKKVALHLLPATHHGGPEFETANNIQLVTDFLDKYLK
ncbi:MAG: alpha/beta hydrolase [Chitinophagaceae bacterium]